MTERLEDPGRSILDGGSGRLRQKKTASAPSDLRRRVQVGGVLGAVLGILLLGAALRTERPVGTPSAVAEPATASSQEAPDEAVAASAAEAPATAETFVPSPGGLTGRARTDAGRLAGAGGAFTLQFLYACNADNVRSQVETLGADRDFYLLPVEDHGRACYRICWGTFPSKEAARTARNIPPPMAALSQTPQVKSIAGVLR